MHPGALESRAQVAEDLGEMREQLRKQLARIRELRVKKVEEPGQSTHEMSSACSFIADACIILLLQTHFTAPKT